MEPGPDEGVASRGGTNMLRRRYCHRKAGKGGCARTLRQHFIPTYRLGLFLASLYSSASVSYWPSLPGTAHGAENHRASGRAGIGRIAHFMRTRRYFQPPMICGLVSMHVITGLASTGLTNRRPYQRSPQFSISPRDEMRP